MLRGIALLVLILAAITLGIRIDLDQALSRHASMVTTEAAPSETREQLIVAETTPVQESEAAEASVDQIAQFTGFGLYDHAFIDVMRQLNDPTPFLRGIVAELGFHRKEIPYTQPKRRAGITHNNLYTLYDAAMLGFTSYTKVGLRMAVFFGASCSAISMLIAIIYLVMKLIWWDRFPAGMAPMLIGMLFLGSVQIFFIGLLGEYILSINQRVMRRPLVVEEERLNFPEDAMIGGMADASK